MMMYKFRGFSDERHTLPAPRNPERMVIGTLRGLRNEHHDLQATIAVAMAVAATMTTPNR